MRNMGIKTSNIITLLLTNHIKISEVTQIPRLLLNYFMVKEEMNQIECFYQKSTMKIEIWNLKFTV